MWIEWFKKDDHRPKDTKINIRLSELLQDQEVSTTTLSNWLPPSAGWSMCNTDVAINDLQSSGAALFRNEDGIITCIHTMHITYCDLLAGVESAISGKSIDVSELNHNIQDLVVKFHDIGNKLDFWEISWISRKFNCASHGVAQWAIRSCHYGEIDLSNFNSSLLDYKTDD
uniref:RNase H type-1 domain-containing protein n=1 Tax=Cannabis sativa TaxID=3483 RepID=A0A803NMS7_CANSA